jgi:alpha-tubulin suppressor-like RCC1 family protein
MKLPAEVYGGAKAFLRPGGSVAPPLLHPHLTDVVSVVCRAERTLALTSDGSVYTWGTCGEFSLGHGDDVTSLPAPRRVAALAGIRIVSIAGGDTCCAAVSQEGEVFTWGWGGSFFSGNGGLGHGNNVSQPSPALVEGLAGVRVAGVSVGGTGRDGAHMLALDREGRVWSWGAGEYGRCGNGRSSQPLPARVEILEEAGGRFVGVAAGGAHSLAVREDGALWAWGKSETGQLGMGPALVADLHSFEEYPARVVVEESAGDGEAFNGRARAVAAGAAHSVAIMKDGSVWQWGLRAFLSPNRVPVAVTAGEGGRGAGQTVPLVAAQVRGNRRRANACFAPRTAPYRFFNPPPPLPPSPRYLFVLAGVCW